MNTKLKVSKDIANSLEYIISQFNATDIDFLYDNFRYLNENHNLFALKILKKEQVLECFLHGFITVEAYSEKDLADVFTVKEHLTKLLLRLRKIDNYYLAYIHEGVDINNDFPYPLTVEQVVDLINIGHWEIVNSNEV